MDTTPVPPIRVLVADDSVVVRRMLSAALDAEPDIEVVGTASDGRIALQKLTLLQPDVVTLDVEMPRMDGLAALVELRRSHPRLPVIMCSAVTSRGAAATLDALSLGANDYVTKPSARGDDFSTMRDDLVGKVRALCRRIRTPPIGQGHARPSRTRPARVAPLDAIVIGVSTGGPTALSTLVPQLPGNLPVPVLVVQHMPPVFTSILAERLDGRSDLRVVEAVDGEPVSPGHVYLAPGGRHLLVERPGQGTRVRVRLDDGPFENSCRPAVDVLFRSAAEVWGAGVLAVVLTGMGFDGRRGSEVIAAAGGAVLAQDEATSVVWGMPGHVVRDGLADDVLPIDRMAGALVQRLALASRRSGGDAARTG